MSIKLLFLGCLITLSTSLWATDEGEFRGETKAKIEILQKQNDELKTKIDAIEKDNHSVEEFKNTIDRQDKRIEDVNAKMGNAAEKTSWLATIVGIWAIVATIVSIILPLIFVPKWKNEAMNEARDASSQWFQNNSSNIDQEIRAFKERLDALKNQAEQKANQYDNTINSYLKKYLEEIKDTSLIQTLSNEQTISIENLYKKPQNEYTFDDWNQLAFDAFQKNQKEDALFYWRKILEINNVPPKIKAVTLLNIAASLSQLNRKEEAIQIYNDLIQEYANNSDEAIQEIIAKGMLLKGITHRQLDQNEKAITTHSDLINMFSNTQNEKIKESLSIAYTAKGTLYVKLNEREKAFETFDEFLEQMSDVSNPAVNKQKVVALEGKSVMYMALSNIDEALRTYNTLITKFKDYSDPDIKIHILDALLKRSEIQLLSYKTVESIPDDLLDETSLYKLKYLILLVLNKALTSDQTEQINQIINEFKEIKLDDFHWEEIETWANNIKDTETKTRVLATIEQFKNWDMDSRSSRE